MSSRAGKKEAEGKGALYVVHYRRPGARPLTTDVQLYDTRAAGDLMTAALNAPRESSGGR